MPLLGVLYIIYLMYLLEVYYYQNLS